MNLGDYASFREALTAAENQAPYLYAIRVPGTLHFDPMGLIIRDSSTLLVLAGWYAIRYILWCAPVTCDSDEQSVRSEASDLKAEAQRASGWNSASIAAGFRRHAERLDAHLVDPL